MRPTLPKEVLDQHVIVLGKTRSGKSSTMRGLVEGLLDAHQPVGIIDPKGDWWGIKSSADGKSAGYPVVIFGGSHADVPINAHAGAHVAELVATGNRPYLIDLGGWMVAERTRFFIDFASTLFRTTTGLRWLVVDEVHNFAPQGKVLDPQAGQMLHWANRLASEGLGKGLQLLAASQRPQKVHKDFVTSCETLIAMKVIHPLDRGAIKDWIDGCPDVEKGREVLTSLASMPRGTGWAWSPEIGFGPKKVAFPMFRTFDSFKPRANADTGKLKGWASVDLDEVKTRLAAVVEEAQANDPKVLRARIAELERRAPAPAVDGKALAQAEARGRAQAKDDLERTGHEISGINSDIAKANSVIQTATVRLGSLQLKLYGAADKTDRASPVSSPSRPAPPVDRPVSVAQSKRRADEDGGALPGPQRRILIALAQYPEGRTKVQTAILTGYAVSGGAFRNPLSALRSRGAVTMGEPIQITEKGLRELGAFEPLPTGRDLLAHWLGKLGGPERKILNALAEVYPKPLNPQQLAVATNYEASGGAFRNPLSRLRTLELVKGRGEIRLSEDLI